jgi:hypothetical protein
VNTVVDDQSFRERLLDICADLMSERRFESFLHQLFSTPPGTWQTLADCCRALDPLPDGANEAFNAIGNGFVVMHLPWPVREDPAEYSLVLFAYPHDLWSTIAMYNRAGLPTRN